MADVVTLGEVAWSRNDMLLHLEEFAELYEKRPIQDNTGGMKSAHMFATWFALKMLQPNVIIESGVWMGQGTWLLEQACPAAELHCIDLNLSRIQYRSPRANYYGQDFATLDWSHTPKENTLLFFDDHQDAYERTKIASWFGFKHLIFEDNYPPSRGDSYSLKKAFSHAGFTPESTQPGAKNSLKFLLRRFVLSTLEGLRVLPPITRNVVSPNAIDAKYLLQNLEVYYEFPPIFRRERTRWGDAWDDEQYPTPTPLLASITKPYEQLFFDEALDYTWICYIKLK